MKPRYYRLFVWHPRIGAAAALNTLGFSRMKNSANWVREFVVRAGPEAARAEARSCLIHLKRLRLRYKFAEEPRAEFPQDDPRPAFVPPPADRDRSSGSRNYAQYFAQ
jgi:hypothetical protein